MILGHAARERAERTAQAILDRATRLNAAKGLGPFTRTSIEVLGAETYFGKASRARDAREVIVAVAAAHPERAALETLAREIAPAATSMAQSISGFAGGRPSVQPVVRLASCFVERDRVSPRVMFESATIDVPATRPLTAGAPRETPSNAVRPAPRPAGDVASREIPLRLIARARSGDKGNVSNIGVLARRPEYLAIIESEVTEQAVAEWLAHLVRGPVTRYDWPGLNGFNFVLRDALGGGGIASLRHDPQGKGFAQILLEMPVRVSAGLSVDSE
jgi:hypothetical protein